MPAYAGLVGINVGGLAQAEIPCMFQWEHMAGQLASEISTVHNFHWQSAFGISSWYSMFTLSKRS